MDNTLIKFNEIYMLQPFGLYNNNIICYFNSLLQSLFSCSSINEYLLKNGIVRRVEDEDKIIFAELP